MSRDLVLSLKPHWAEEIFSGRKTVEVRRRFPIAADMELRALIYTTSPVKSLTGEVRVVSAQRFDLDELKENWTERSRVSAEMMDAYLGDLGAGVLLFVERPVRYETPIPLAQLRDRFGFTPPQSYAYAHEDLSKSAGLT